MNVVTIDPLTDERWLAFISTAPGATVYHHPAWFRVMTETYGYHPVCQAALDGDRVVGILPVMEVRSWLTGNRGVCMPFSDVCGAVLVESGELSDLVAAGNEIRKSRGWKYLEIRSPLAPGVGTVTARFKGHRARLSPDAGVMFRSFKKTQIQQRITKAEKLGVVVERRTDEEALRAFISLNAATRRKHGVPPQPDSFFRNIRRHLLDAGLGFIGVAWYGGRVAATGVYLHWGESVVYKYSASDEAALSCKPNHAVMWDAIRWAGEKGFKEMDFGRTDLDNESLMEYKRGWGSEEIDLSYVRFGEGVRAGAGVQGGGMERLKPIISRLPLPLLKMVGRSVYAHIG